MKQRRTYTNTKPKALYFDLLLIEFVWFSATNLKQCPLACDVNGAFDFHLNHSRAVGTSNKIRQYSAHLTKTININNAPTPLDFRKSNKS